MGISIWENNWNGNKCLVGMGIGMGTGLKLMGMGRNGKAEGYSRTPLCHSIRRGSRVHSVAQRPNVGQLLPI